MPPSVQVSQLHMRAVYHRWWHQHTALGATLWCSLRRIKQGGVLLKTIVCEIGGPSISQSLLTHPLISNVKFNHP